MKSVNTNKAREIRTLNRMKDSAIDTSAIPPLSDWSKAVVGKFYKPIKKPLTLRIDADVLSWLKQSGPGYQTRVNALLRDAMLKSERRPR